MGMTPLQGLVMGTRSGDLDPGLHAFLHREAGMSIDDIDTMLNRRSGLQGIAGANDYRTVEGRAAQGDERARLAIEVFVHRLRHYVGAYLAHLGRLDVLTFTAGIGQNSATVRAAVVEGLGGLGLRLDAGRNEAHSNKPRVVSADESPVTIAVVPTNEELAIARQTAALIAKRGP